jgi:hypothetical protein
VRWSSSVLTELLNKDRSRAMRTPVFLFQTS